MKNAVDMMGRFLVTSAYLSYRAHWFAANAWVAGRLLGMKPSWQQARAWEEEIALVRASLAAAAITGAAKESLAGRAQHGVNILMDAAQKGQVITRDSLSILFGQKDDAREVQEAYATAASTATGVNPDEFMAEIEQMQKDYEARLLRHLDRVGAAVNAGQDAAKS